MGNARIIYADSLKGFAIILVILGHVIQMWYGGDFIHNKLWLYIYSFHMPLFMFISGFIAGIFHDKKGMALFIKKRFIQLLIPFFAWTFVYLLKDKNFSLWEIIQTPSHKLWFLWALFFISVIHALDKKLSQKLSINVYAVYLVSIIAVFFLSVSVDGKFGLSEITRYLYVYIIGVVTGTYKHFIFNSAQSKWLASGLLLWGLFAYFWVWPSKEITPPRF